MINEVEIAVAQVERMVNEGTVVAVNGDVINLEADTVCIHGDSPQAVSFASRLREALVAKQINIKCFL